MRYNSSPEDKIITYVLILLSILVTILLISYTFSSYRIIKKHDKKMIYYHANIEVVNGTISSNQLTASKNQMSNIATIKGNSNSYVTECSANQKIIVTSNYVYFEKLTRDTKCIIVFK